DTDSRIGGVADTDPSARSVVSSGPVIVGVDGSSNARRALSMAAEIAKRFDLDLAVFHAIGIMTVIDGRHVPSEGHRDDLERLLRLEWCAPLADDHELRWRAELVYGSPPDVLLKMGSELDASFVVVGSRGVGDEQALGSTSHHVVHHCDRPVVVVPPADRSV
ncbi:MAG TPA: universal stress protein, partial [Ilumatobacteraceae bacterium]|nr:universal stress protein [Ilumatobacteraceae bacterium]